MEYLILFLALVPVVVRANLGWRMGADMEIRRLLVYVLAGVVTLVFGNLVANWLAQGFGGVEPHILLACIFLAIFALTAGVATLVLNHLRPPAESDAVTSSERISGLVAGLFFGAIIGVVLVGVAGLAIPSLDSASLPLAGDKPLGLLRAVEKSIALAPWAPPPAPALESAEPAEMSEAPKVTAVPTPAAPAIPAAPVATPPPRPKINYQNFSYEEVLDKARENHETALSVRSAFRLSELEEAKAKAQREGKLLGFIMVWGSFFKDPDEPMGTGSVSGLVHFYQVFNASMVLVFVRHETELNLVPDAVKRGFFGPEEGGFSPNMAVVSADALDYICEIPFGGNNSDGVIRESIFRGKIGTVQAWLAAQAKTP